MPPASLIVQNRVLKLDRPQVSVLDRRPLLTDLNGIGCCCGGVNCDGCCKSSGGPNCTGSCCHTRGDIGSDEVVGVVYHAEDERTGDFRVLTITQTGASTLIQEISGCVFYFSALYELTNTNPVRECSVAITASLHAGLTLSPGPGACRWWETPVATIPSQCSSQGMLVPRRNLIDVLPSRPIETCDLADSHWGETGQGYRFAATFQLAVNKVPPRCVDNCTRCP